MFAGVAPAETNGPSTADRGGRLMREGGLTMMIGMALFWGAIILGVVWLIRDGTEPQQRQPKETALTILHRRFAAGAVSLEEYRQRRDVLTGTTKPHSDQGVSSAAIEAQ
jgi:putative membrane protein